MAFKPNYSQQRRDRDRAKAQKKKEKEERRKSAAQQRKALRDDVVDGDCEPDGNESAPPSGRP